MPGASPSRHPALLVQPGIIRGGPLPPPVRGGRQSPCRSSGSLQIRSASPAGSPAVLRGEQPCARELQFVSSSQAPSVLTTACPPPALAPAQASLLDAGGRLQIHRGRRRGGAAGCEAAGDAAHRPPLRRGQGAPCFSPRPRFSSTLVAQKLRPRTFRSPPLHTPPTPIIVAGHRSATGRPASSSTASTSAGTSCGRSRRRTARRTTPTSGSAGRCRSA